MASVLLPTHSSIFGNAFTAPQTWNIIWPDSASGARRKRSWTHVPSPGVLAILAVLASGAVAAFHVGVEQGWWPSPLPGCQVPRATGGGSIDDMMRSLAPAPSKPCDAPTYLVPGLPVSMAAMNLLYALGLGGFVLIWAAKGARKR